MSSSSSDARTGGDAVTGSDSAATTGARRGSTAVSRSASTDRRSIGRFLREVIAELGKVIWPGRKELITYTTVVIVFVTIMVALVAGLDILFAKGVLAVFG